MYNGIKNIKNLGINLTEDLHPSGLFPGGPTWRDRAPGGRGRCLVLPPGLGQWFSLKNLLSLRCMLKTRNIAESNLTRLKFMFMKWNLYFISIFLNVLDGFGAGPAKIPASYSEEIDTCV